MTIEQVGILLSLLITILGWSVTAYYQRRILERQIAAEREKEIRQAIIPRKIQLLEQIKSWVEEGYKLWHLWRGRSSQEYISRQDVVSKELLREQREKLDEQIKNWTTVEYTTIEALVEIVEPFNPLIEDSLNTILKELVRAMPTGNPHYYDEHPDYEKKSNIVIDTYYPKALWKINALIEKIIQEKYPSKN